MNRLLIFLGFAATAIVTACAQSGVQSQEDSIVNAIAQSDEYYDFTVIHLSLTSDLALNKYVDGRIDPLLDSLDATGVTGWCEIDPQLFANIDGGSEYVIKHCHLSKATDRLSSKFDWIDLSDELRNRVFKEFNLAHPELSSEAAHEIYNQSIRKH